MVWRGPGAIHQLGGQLLSVGPGAFGHMRGLAQQHREVGQRQLPGRHRERSRLRDRSE